jgi:hypothetical protein
MLTPFMFQKFDKATLDGVIDFSCPGCGDTFDSETAEEQDFYCDCGTKLVKEV